MIILYAETPHDQEMIEKFQRAYENLKKIVDKIQDENRTLREENRKLMEELNEYRKRHPANVGVKNGKTYEIAEVNAIHQEWDTQQGSERRKPGAQIGHKGFSRITPKTTRRVKVHLDLNECHSSLIHKGTRKRIIEDIPMIEPEVIKYRLDRLYCKRCHRVYEPGIPEAFPGSTLSLRVMLTVAYFRIGMRMSVENTAATMLNIFGIRISEGGIQNILSQLSDSLGSEYASLLQAIRDAPSRHMDSTSWSVDGNPYNLWTFLTRSDAIFDLSNGNGNQVPLEVLADDEGTDIRDRHSAFETMNKNDDNDQQYGWSHTICDAKELEEFHDYKGSRIKRSHQTVFEEAKAFNGYGTMDDIERLYHKLVFLLDSDYEHRRSRRFVDNLLKRKKEWLFRFVIDPEVDPTNNRAERALRPSVIYRKVSGGSRSERGAEIYTKIYSVYYTSRLRGKNFIEDTPSIIKRSAKPG